MHCRITEPPYIVLSQYPQHFCLSTTGLSDSYSRNALALEKSQSVLLCLCSGLYWAHLSPGEVESEETATDTGAARGTYILWGIGQEGRVRES